MSILEQIESVRNSFLADIESFPTNSLEIDAFRSKYIGRKGKVAQLFSQLGKADNDERPIFGQKLNVGKPLASAVINKLAGGPISLVFDAYI